MGENQGLNKCINKVLNYTNFNFDWYLRIDDTDSIVFLDNRERNALSKGKKIYSLIKEVTKNNQKFCTVVDYQVDEFRKVVAQPLKGVIPSPDGAGVIVSGEFLKKISPFPKDTRYGDDIWLWFHFLKLERSNSFGLVKSLAYKYKLTTMSFEKSERVHERFILLSRIKENL